MAFGILLRHVSWDEGVEVWTRFVRRFDYLVTPYDAAYLYVADIESCEFWTADERLVRTVGSELPWVRSPREFSSTSDLVCIDASLYLSILLPDEHSPEALAAFERWRTLDADIVAPSVFIWECINALRQSVRRERLTDEEALDLLGDLVALPLGIVPIEEAAEDVWSRFVVEFGLPSVYDATYLAVADAEGCELWTEDHRLYNTVHKHLGPVRVA